MSGIEYFPIIEVITCPFKLRSCISYILPCNKSPQNTEAYKNNTHLLSHCFGGQESGCGLAGSFASYFCRRLQPSVCPRSVSGLIWRLNCRSIHFQAQWLLAALSSLLAIDQRSPSFPCHIGFSHKAACIMKACKMARQ